MAYTKLYNGSSGEDVKRLQTQLNEQGYSLDVDGVFGSQTESAVRDYQTKNNLAVDGVVGDETWGHLDSVKKSAAEPAKAPDFSQYMYDPTTDEKYLKEVEKLQQIQSSKPVVSDQSRYDAELDALYQKIMNREKFSYDVNADPVYQQYRDQYIVGGQQAMQDTMGQAAGLTGGYGSTYGQNAGQQAYHAYLQQLNAVVPELYGRAADEYAREGEALYDQYAMIGALRDDEYQRQQDALTRWWQEVENQQGVVDQTRAQGADNWWNAQNIAYQKERDAIEDARYEQEWAAAQAAARSYGGGGYDDGSYDGSGPDDDPKEPTGGPQPYDGGQLGAMTDQDFEQFEERMKWRVINMWKGNYAESMKDLDTYYKPYLNERQYLLIKAMIQDMVE